MTCKYRSICPYQRQKNPANAERFAKDNVTFCEGKCDTCAIFNVIATTNFLKVPADMTPDQTARLAQILKQDFTSIRI